jgi:hypothetical protein
MQVFLNDDPPRRLTFRDRVRSRVGTWTRENPEPPPRPVTFIDGGFGPANNPSEEVYFEVTTLNENIGTFVSIGTGRAKPNRFHSGLKKLIKTSFAVAGDPEAAHVAVMNKANEQGFGYFRLNQPNGLPNLDFDEWKPRKSGARTKRKILESFREWALDPTVLGNIQHCAMELVRRRRLRTEDFSKWESYALGAFFDCEEDCCPKPGDKRWVWHNRDDFKKHLIDDHRREEGKQLENTIRRYRKVWVYKPPPSNGTF